jgi:hypothetical protein
MKIIHDPLPLGGFSTGASFTSVELLEGIENKTFTVGTILELEKLVKSYNHKMYHTPGIYEVVEKKSRVAIEDKYGQFGFEWVIEHKLKKRE